MMTPDEQRLLIEAIVVRLTIIVGLLSLMSLFFWNVLTMNLSWMQVPAAIGYMLVVLKLHDRCEQDAKEYYNPRLAQITDEHDL